MFFTKPKQWTRCLLTMVLIAILPLIALAEQEKPRSTNELEKDLRATQKEFKKFQSLDSKLASAAKQSSNSARTSVTQDFQDFMGECIKRREGDLSEVMTIKQHGKMVQSGTTDVAEVGSKVPGNKRAKFSQDLGASSNPRVRQLSSMKSLYISAKNSLQPAVERQGDAFDRYSDTIAKFGQQLQWGLNELTAELDRRAAESQKTEEDVPDDGGSR